MKERINFPRAAAKRKGLPFLIREREIRHGEFYGPAADSLGALGGMGIRAQRSWREGC